MDINKFNVASHGTLNQLIEEIIKEHTGAIRPEDLPIIKIVDHLLQLGYANGASDIHIEPYEEKTLLRFRVDGLLNDILELPRHLHELVTTRIKILSRLRTDEHHAAQDGKLRFKHENLNIDVRVSIIPVIYGEKTVLRILAENVNQFNLENLGFSPKDLQKILRNIKRPWGMILATGPTGSGKTTTLYGILKKLNKREINISTIEDPVEYVIDDINQIQVNPKTNLTFSSGLRSILRQDPDIIMVGEIRDEETANIAINSALTGHLVLSTLHTNDASTTMPRLMDMEIQSFLVASTVNIAIAQRLVRKICDKCKEKRKVEKVILDVVRNQFSPGLIKKYQLDNDNIELFYGKGCDICQMSGYKGRSVIAEVLEITDPIREMVMREANAGEIAAKAAELGMTPIIEDGMDKVFQGVTNLEELLRVAQE